MYAVVVNGAGAGDGHKKIGTVQSEPSPRSRKGSLAKKRLLTMPSDDEKRTAERSEQIFSDCSLNTTDQNRFAIFHRFAYQRLIR